MDWPSRPQFALNRKGKLSVFGSNDIRFAPNKGVTIFPLTYCLGVNVTSVQEIEQQQERFYQSLGFSTNPFEGNTAEREPEIELYVVRPPYLDPVEEASLKTGSYTLSGTRGSGKSATRITVQRNVWSKARPHPLPIALTNFNNFRGKKNPAELLDLFASQVFYLTIEAALVYFTTVDQAELDSLFNKFDKATRKFVDWSLKNYYLNRSQATRDSTAQECFDLFAVSLARRSQLWAEKKWGAVTAGLIDLAAGIAKRFDVDVGETAAYKEIFAQEKAAEGSDPLFVLKKAVEFARTMGFSGLLVQVDKVDETDWTQNSADDAAKLVWPLYTNVQLHEIDGLSWSFFLWDQVRTLLGKENAMPVRWDKLPNDRIKWDQNHLIRLVERRISHFSGDKLKSLSNLFDGENLVENDLYSALFSLSGMAPRTLVTVLNSVLINHIQEVEGQSKLMTVESLERGLDTYATNTITNDYTPQTIAQLQRVGTARFVTKDVAKVFAISSTGARQKINKWIDSGLVHQTAAISTGEGKKPVDQFLISEPRVKRIVERGLELPDQ